MLLKPKKIVIEKSVAELHVTKNTVLKFRGVAIEYVDEFTGRNNGFNPNELIITRQKGKFVKRCPGTPDYLCCDYYVLDLGIGCAFDCTYCFLHHYMNTPFTIYANVDDLIAEVEEFCWSNPNRTIRLGSGEFVDSIGFDELTGINKILVPAFSKIPNLVFEIKTKSKNIDRLLPLKHNGKVVTAWSVNPDIIIKSEELGTPSLKERLEAAHKCQEAGYKIGFHFDPLIYYQKWETDYKVVVDAIFDYISPKNISWISLGAFRFNPASKQVIKEKFPKCNLIYEELVPGLDGKLRYFITIRKKMFSALLKYIRKHSTEITVYLCMESKVLSQEIGTIPGFNLNLSHH